MRKFLLIVFSLAFSTAALANGGSCQAAASAQKLVGTAKAAFLKKCEAESRTKLNLVSKEKSMSVAPTSAFGHCEHDSKDL